MKTIGRIKSLGVFHYCALADVIRPIRFHPLDRSSPWF
jgi:hypothetical protein